MASLEEIKAQISDFSNAKGIMNKKEIKALPEILWQDEVVKKACSGAYKLDIGLLVATNKRVIFISKSLFSLKVEDFAYDKITSTQYSTGMIFGDIIIYAAGNKAKIKDIDKHDAKDMAEFIRAFISNNSESEFDLTKEIEKLAKLKEQGAINDDEFTQLKAKLIAKI